MNPFLVTDGHWDIQPPIAIIAKKYHICSNHVISALGTSRPFAAVPQNVGGRTSSGPVTDIVEST